MRDPTFGHLPEQVEWEYFSPSTFLSEAVSALLDLLDPHGPTSPVGGAYHRTRWARIAIIFAAFAAEGYINRALMRGLPARDFDALERLSTLDKYALGPRVVFGRDLFDRGAEPLQTVGQLFELRNKMAHPKPRSEQMSRDEMLAGPEAEVYTPTDAVRFVSAVGAAGLTLSEAIDASATDAFASLVVGMRDELLRVARMAEALPRPTLADYEATMARTRERIDEVRPS